MNQWQILGRYQKLWLLLCRLRCVTRTYIDCKVTHTRISDAAKNEIWLWYSYKRRSATTNTVTVNANTTITTTVSNPAFRLSSSFIYPTDQIYETNAMRGRIEELNHKNYTSRVKKDRRPSAHFRISSDDGLLIDRWTYRSSVSIGINSCNHIIFYSYSLWYDLEH